MTVFFHRRGEIFGHFPISFANFVTHEIRISFERSLKRNLKRERGAKQGSKEISFKKRDPNNNGNNSLMESWHPAKISLENITRSEMKRFKNRFFLQNFCGKNPLSIFATLPLWNMSKSSLLSLYLFKQFCLQAFCKYTQYMARHTHPV